MVSLAALLAFTTLTHMSGAWPVVRWIFWGDSALLHVSSFIVPRWAGTLGRVIPEGQEELAYPKSKPVRSLSSHQTHDCQGEGCLTLPTVGERCKNIWERHQHGEGEDLDHFCNLSLRLRRHSNEHTYVAVALHKVKIPCEMPASASATPSSLAQAFFESTKNTLLKIM